MIMQEYLIYKCVMSSLLCFKTYEPKGEFARLDKFDYLSNKEDVLK